MTTPPLGSREAAQALDEIEAALKRANMELTVPAAEYVPAIPASWDHIKAAQKALATLRAALAPPADGAGEVEEIRKRLNDRKPSGPRGHVPPLTQSERDMATLLRLLSEERDRRVEVEAEVADLKQTVIAFAGPAAARYALDAGFAKGELHPTHYDVLARCGARMVDFKRGEVSRATHKDTQDE